METQTKNIGKIIFRQHGLIRTYDCTCGAQCCEADEGGVVCFSSPEYGLNGCGATSRWPENVSLSVESEVQK